MASFFPYISNCKRELSKRTKKPRRLQEKLLDLFVPLSLVALKAGLRLVMENGLRNHENEECGWRLKSVRSSPRQISPCTPASR
ncbi:hypothetical protein EMPG_16102 [Blastomyces silverae]|uniref:Uncharacterized protein n=1 Tax=Blastomyces silverae TaxID=2060906 RepID=A0A0H1BBH5_9EURO|nr:hypothetical protein EMPG_16102 [Blastomyces silverae]